MRTIKLSQNQVALVDTADYERLSLWKWYVQKKGRNFYAVRKKNNKQIYMARQILGLIPGDKREADHKNLLTLDNRQSNLRICTHQQNTRNRGVYSNSSSQFKGVSLHKPNGKWRARIEINGKLKSLGYFKVEKEAALAYDTMAIREFGDFAYLNFKEIAI